MTRVPPTEYTPETPSSPWETVMELDVLITEALVMELARLTKLPEAFWRKRERNYRKALTRQDANRVVKG